MSSTGDGELAELGDGAAVSVVLHADPDARPAGRHAGLYHYALLHPTREELARAAARLAATRTAIQGASDYGHPRGHLSPRPRHRRLSGIIPGMTARRPPGEPHGDRSA